MGYVTHLSGLIWTPALLSTSLWLDASDSSNIMSNDNNVVRWNDKSINGNHVSQATPSAQPLLATTGAQSINEKNAVYFSGSTFLSANLSDFLYNQGSASAFAVVKAAAQTDSRIVALGLSTNNNPIYSLLQTGGISNATALSSFMRSNGGTTLVSSTGEQNIANAFPVGGATRIIGAIDTGNTIQHSLDGVPGNDLAYTRVGAFTSDRFSVGALLRSTTISFFTGSISEIILLNTSISTDARQKLEGYLAWKWGLIANLPANHPYKNYPPLV